MKAFCKHAGHQNTEPGNDVFASPAFVDPLKAALDQKKMIKEENEETDAFKNGQADEIDPRLVTKHLL